MERDAQVSEGGRGPPGAGSGVLGAPPSRKVLEAEIVVRRDGALVHADDAALRLYGYTREELLHLDVRRLWAAGVLEELEARMGQALEGGAHFETRHRRKDGSVLEVEVAATGFAVGELGYFRAKVRDLTELRRAEQQHRVLAELVRQMAEGILVTGPDLTITEYTGRAEQLYGWTRAEAVGRNLRTDFQYQFPDGDGDRLEAHVAAGQDARTNMRCLRKDGVWAELDVMFTPLRDLGGALTGWLSVARDRGPALAALRAREESERRLQALYAALGEGVILLDARGQVLECNSAAERLLGLTLAQLQRREPVDPAWATLDEQGRELPPERWPSSEALRTGQPLRGQVLGVRRPGQPPLWLSANAEPVRLAPGEPPHGVVSTFALLPR